MESPDVLSEGDFEDIQNNSWHVAFVMRMEYYDKFGNHYWTDSCLSRLRTGAYPQCPKHNEIH